MTALDGVVPGSASPIVCDSSAAVSSSASHEEGCAEPATLERRDSLAIVTNPGIRNERREASRSASRRLVVREALALEQLLNDGYKILAHASQGHESQDIGSSPTVAEEDRRERGASKGVG